MRKKSRTLTECVRLIMDSDKNKAESLCGEDAQGGMLIASALVKRAEGGDVSAVKEIRAILGDNAEEKNDCRIIIKFVNPDENCAERSAAKK